MQEALNTVHCIPGMEDRGMSKSQILWTRAYFLVGKLGVHPIRICDREHRGLPALTEVQER